MAIVCIKCNGTGLISTGADPLALHQGIQVTCAACSGRGKLAETVQEVMDGFVPMSGLEDKEPAVEESPKVQDPSQDALSGSGSSESSEGATFVEPQIGSKCLTEGQNLPGHLDKNEVGDWVCIPD